MNIVLRGLGLMLKVRMNRWGGGYAGQSTEQVDDWGKTDGSSFKVPLAGEPLKDFRARKTAERPLVRRMSTLLCVDTACFPCLRFYTGNPLNIHALALYSDAGFQDKQDSRFEGAVKIYFFLLINKSQSWKPTD